MKKAKLFLCIAALVLLMGCAPEGKNKSTPDNASNTTQKNSSGGNVPETLWGDWLYIDDGQTLFVGSSTTLEYTQVSPNLIEVESSGEKRYLMRKGIANVEVKGEVRKTVNKKTTASKHPASYSGVAGINVILSNLQDDDMEKSSQTDDNGQFQTAGVVTGEYEISAEDEEGNSVSATVTVDGESKTVGVLTLADEEGYNFKTEAIMDDKYVYGDLTTYTGKIRITNVGNQDALGLNYTLSTDSQYVELFEEKSDVGTVEKDKYIDIPFSISFNFLDVYQTEIKIDVTIRDVDYNEWSDYATIVVYKSPVKINIKASSAKVKGYLIIPGHNLVSIQTSNSAIEVPYLPTKNYSLVLANPDIGDETKYSIGFNTGTLDYTDFTDTGVYEPNNNENEATSINIGEAIVSYMHKGDLDYYTLDMSDQSLKVLLAPPQIPVK